MAARLNGVERGGEGVAARLNLADRDAERVAAWLELRGREGEWVAAGKSWLAVKASARRSAADGSSRGG